MSTVQAIVEEAIRLALAGGLPLLHVLVIIAVAAVLLVLGRNLPSPTEPGPNEDAARPPAVWGDNVTPNDGPPGGGMEGG